MCLLSPAKLNLGLRIVGRRNDGLHLLESLFWPINLFDELEVRPAERTGVTTRWATDAVKPDPHLPPESENLVFRALQAAGAGHWEVEVTKRIPMGAGLGGGSSNAGTLLKWLAEIGNLSPERRDALAPSLGADVPYFLSPRPAWVTGIGEQRQELLSAMPEMYFLLIFPREPLNTKSVFTAYRDASLRFSNHRPVPSDLLRYFREDVGNDLEVAACQLLPRLGSILSRLRREPVLYAGLTGSGSTCFAVFNSADDREKSSKVLQPFLRENFCRSLTAETCIAP